MPEKLYTTMPFSRLWLGKDPFRCARELSGEEFRRVKSRRTFRFEIDGEGFFAKVHHGTGWKEILKNLLQFKHPVLGAGNEYRALELLHRIGVDTMTARAYGERGCNPARRQSFLITEELCGMESLEDHCRDWQPPFRSKLKLLEHLAATLKAMHENGLNHRDCYLCHFLLDLQAWRDGEGEAHLYVIDLHRAQIRERIPRHYRVKDVAGIYFSSMDAGITRHDLWRFMKIYSGKSLRDTLRRDGAFWRAVDKAAHKLYRKEFRCDPPGLR